MYTQLLEKQRTFFGSGKTREIAFRIEKLKQLREYIYNHMDEITAAIRNDFGKSNFETFATEVMLVADEINIAIKNLRSWSKPIKVKTPLTFFKASSRVYNQPFGVVLIIGAWNYPFLLSLDPMIGAIAAGNSCIVKPSELSSNTSRLLAGMIRECFDEGHCAVVEGGVEETTLLLEEKFDFIHYTGSTRVGQVIAQAAARNLTPVVLELGGKSPCIVDRTADLKISVRRIAWGKFINAGQTCIAPDYVFVHKEIKNDFIVAMREQLREFYGDDVQASPDYCRIINERHFERLSNLLKNENVQIGGKTDKKQLYIEPTVIEPLTWDAPVMQEEIFGPILPVFTYEDLSQVIAKINRYERPLALYFFSKDKKAQKRLIDEVPFGGGCINTTMMHCGNPYLPFGGIGHSGLGNYHGKWSFDTFSHKKSILNKSLLIDFKFLYPPYKNKVQLLKRFIVKG